MKIEKVKGLDGGYILELDNGTRWDIEDLHNGKYYVDCHVYGPDDIDEWREHAKSMLAFCDVVETLQRMFPDPDLEIETENFGSEQEIAATVYLDQNHIDFLIEKYHD